MANKNIVSLGPITVPLMGTEVIPIWNGTTTTKVTVADLTAGRDVLAKTLTLLGAGSGNLVNYQFPTLGTVGGVYVDSATIYFGGGTFAYTNSWATSHSTNGIAGYVAGVQRVGVDSSGNISASTGNFVPAVSGKGIDFSAVTPAAGMTSKVLTNYEEGTWTPTQGAGLTVVGTFSSLGKYTRIGRQVTITGSLFGSTTIAATAGGVLTSGYPYLVTNVVPGTAISSNILGSLTYVSAGSGGVMYSEIAIPAAGAIHISATYFV